MVNQLEGYYALRGKCYTPPAEVKTRKRQLRQSRLLRTRVRGLVSYLICSDMPLSAFLS